MCGGKARGKGRAVADSRYQRVFGGQELVYQDAVARGQAGIRRQLAVRVYTDADDNGFTFGDLPAGSLDARHLAVVGGDAVDRGAQDKTHAQGFMVVLESAAYGFANHAAHEAGGGFHHRNNHAFARGDRGELQAQEARANHHDLAQRAKLFADSASVVQASKAEDTAGHSDGAGQLAVACARCQHQVCVGQPIACAGLYKMPNTVDTRDPRTGCHIDLVFGVVGVTLEAQGRRLHVAAHIGLGQRRALVGQMGFIPHQTDVARIPLVTQGRDKLVGGLAGANDKDSWLIHGAMVAC